MNRAKSQPFVDRKAESEPGEYDQLRESCWLFVPGPIGSKWRVKAEWLKVPAVGSKAKESNCDEMS